MEVTDFVGTPIKVGSVITYPGRHGSNMWINVGVVVEVEEYEDRGHPRIRLHVDRIERGLNWSFEGYPKPWCVQVKRVKLDRVSRVTVTPLTREELMARVEAEL